MKGYARLLKKLLLDAGCHFERQGRGDHEIWFSPLSGHYFTVDGTIRSRHTANETLKQAGLVKAF